MQSAPPNYDDFWRQYEEEGLCLWTLYKHPSDAPQHWVIRRALATREGKVRPGSGVGFLSREEAEASVPGDKVWLARADDDEPQIMGSWI